MVIRDGRASIEVLMLRRSLDLDFMRGAFVFPGGGVDASDGDPEMLGRCMGRTDEQASSVLGLPSGGLTYWVSAIRECFEETGILVATREDGAICFLDDPMLAKRFVVYRNTLSARERTFLEVCRVEDLTLLANSVHYVDHWVTPEGLSRRYDVRFFATIAPSGQTPVQDGVEAIDHMWVAPDDAIAQMETGRIGLMPPTVWHLRLLARHPTVANFVETLSNPGTVATIEREAEGFQLEFAQSGMLPKFDELFHHPNKS